MIKHCVHLLFTLGETGLASGDTVDSLHSKSPGLVHEQHRVLDQVDLQDRALHPHQRHRQRAASARPHHVRVPAASGGPQLGGQHLHRGRTLLVPAGFIGFTHYL